MPRTPFQPTVRSHRWAGFRYASRVARSAAPRLDPVVLVGGALHRKEDWGRVEQGMVESADVIATDLPGWGEADLLPSEAGPELLAESLRRMLDDLGVERANVFAGSYGTAIAFRFAQLHPERIGRMVLAGTMSSIPAWARPAMWEAVELAVSGPRERFGPRAVEVLMCGDPEADIASRTVVERVISRRFGGVGADEIAKFVANTRRLLAGDLIDASLAPAVPIAFTTGSHDTLTPPRLCRELALRCSESWFVEIARADHLIHLERPRELVDLMTRFFGRERLEGLPYAASVEDLRRVPALA